MQAILGIGFLLILCFLLSEARRDVHWRAVAVGLVLQLFIATILLRVPVVSETLFLLNGIVEAVEQAVGRHRSQ